MVQTHFGYPQTQIGGSYQELLHVHSCNPNSMKIAQLYREQSNYNEQLLIQLGDFYIGQA